MKGIYLTTRNWSSHARAHASLTAIPGQGSLLGWAVFAQVQCVHFIELHETENLSEPRVASQYVPAVPGRAHPRSSGSGWQPRISRVSSSTQRGLGVCRTRQAQKRGKAGETWKGGIGSLEEVKAPAEINHNLEPSGAARIGASSHEDERRKAGEGLGPLNLQPSTGGRGIARSLIPCNAWRVGWQVYLEYS